MDVILHIYDVTNSDSDKANNTVTNINKFFKDGIGLGGIFHSAVQVYGDDEWSFGFCEEGTGVFSFPITQNPMYTYREKLVLGRTSLSIFKINQILREFSREWPGFSYDLLSRNCNHFCDELCDRLGVPKLPGWVNRFANAGDAAVEIAGNAAYRFRQAKTEIVSASKVAYKFLQGIATNSNSQASTDNPSPNRASSRFEVTWIKKVIPAGDKPSTSSVLEGPNPIRNKKQGDNDATPLHQNGHHGS